MKVSNLICLEIDHVREEMDGFCYVESSEEGDSVPTPTQTGQTGKTGRQFVKWKLIQCMSLFPFAVQIIGTESDSSLEYGRHSK